MVSGAQHLPRSAILRERGAFERVFSSRRVVSDPLFRVHHAPGSAASARLGMTVSRRVSPLAVVRNRIRRQIRESFRLARPGLGTLDLVVVARAPAAQASNAELSQALAQIWPRLAPPDGTEAGHNADRLQAGNRSGHD